MAIIQEHLTLNCAGKLVDLFEPQVMGILNVTPDSFYDGGKFNSIQLAIDQVGLMLNAGARFIDIGGVSTRPGAIDVSEDEELNRILPIVKAVRSNFPDCIMSVDTSKWEVAKQAVDSGAGMINDVSSGQLDPKLWPNLPSLNVPYVLMHMQKSPKDMQDKPSYQDVSLEVFDFLSKGIQTLRQLGQKDIIVDPGFGFGKTIAHNYQLLKNLQNFKILGCPILVGISRKSMLYKPLNILPNDALNASTAVHMVSLINGAKILRTHDVKEAKECIDIYKAMQAS